MPLTDDDLYLFNEGNHYHLYRKLGCHLGTLNGAAGASFAVWAPNANYVSVIGDFNGWNKSAAKLTPRGSSGIWEGFIAGVKKGDAYKYHVGSGHLGLQVDKADPFGVHHETSPKTGSKVWDLEYAWGDAGWMAGRRAKNALSSPVSIYEVHLGSWMRVPEDGYRSLSYRELAEKLVPYVTDLGFTHVEFLPVMEHPFYGSWGYQTTGYFAPTSRYGTPQDFMYLVDRLHQAGVGVILDWVPSHFPTDQHGLADFDGTHLYEHADMRQGFHPDWNSYIFNYGRHEVRSFLLSSAFMWLDVYHADALRVDAVASMLYLDYSRKPGEWIPNRFGGHENLEAVDFIRRFNTAVYERFPDTQTIAEESTAWPMVSRPTYVGGLGFGLKWDMGWMHDTLKYLAQGPGAPALPPQRADVPRAVRVHRELLPAALARRGRARQGLAPGADARRRVAAVRQPPHAPGATCTRSPARSCCSWAVRSRRAGNGATRRAWNGICSSARRTRACSG